MVNTISLHMERSLIMVALEDYANDPVHIEDHDDVRFAVVRDMAGQRFIEVIDERGNPIAYVPESMGRDQAMAHAQLFAEAPRLLDLIRFASANVTDHAHPGLLRAFKSYCNKALDRIDSRIMIG